MSFVDLAALATHRRSEMEARIAVLAGKCDQAQSNLMKLKLQAQCLVNKLNCDPTELKENFLTGMKQLDEFIYMVTDFNLAVGQIQETASHEFTPVQDASHTTLQMSFPASNLFDVLSDPVPSTSMAMAFPKQLVSKPSKPKKKKLPKIEDVLIEFSSTSCSQESVPQDQTVQVKEADCKPPVDALNNLTIKDEPTVASSAVDKWNLPEQKVLETDVVYQGLIMHVDGKALWIITDETGATELMVSMRDYYMKSNISLTRDQLRSLAYCYCAFYDHDSDCSYRCLLIRFIEESDRAELFLVDTGEVRFAPRDVIQPLARPFCSKPPFARCCYLAGVDLIEHNNAELMKKQEDFLRSFIGQQCDIEVDDNTSESLGVYIGLPTKELLNQLLVDRGFATPIEKAKSVAAPAPAEVSPIRGPPEVLPDEDFSISDGPEYEDPLEAVTGYHNRDEMDICKHYKGGADRSCFKGARCKKKHIMKHPDGWTLDKVEVAGKGREAPLPPPGSWHKVRVTYVGHFDHVHVQFVTPPVEEEKRAFGRVLPPKTLDSLVRDMNSPAARTAHRPLKIAPAPGELVAALYPPDDQWYRAVVLAHTTHDQSVQVRYVDYGNELWVREDKIRELDLAYTVLPLQAVRCKLAGVTCTSSDPDHWLSAKQALQALALDRQLDCHIVGRDYDELDIELYESEGYSIAEKLAATNSNIKVVEYDVVDDIDVPQKIVVP